MDITPYAELKIAPLHVFDALPERRTRVRFMLLTPDGLWRAVTWGGFASQIRRAALFLARIGLASGERAAIFAPNRVEWIAAALAVQAAGGVMVPIYPASTAEQAAYVVEHSDARVVFVDTPALLGRVFQNLGRLREGHEDRPPRRGPRRRKSSGEARGGGKKVPAYAEAQERLITWPEALAIGLSATKRIRPSSSGRCAPSPSINRG